MPDNLTLALGTGEVTQLEMANAYATFADARATTRTRSSWCG